MTVVIGAQAKDITHLFKSATGAPTPLLSDLSILKTIATVALVRPECESQPQFIHFATYAILRDKTTKDVFIYQRGKKGGEANLHGAWSIGVGGHVEKSNSVNDNLIDHIVRTFAIELREEVSLDIGVVMGAGLTKRLTDGDEKTLLIHDDTNDVGKVHVGIVTIIDIDKSQLGDLEDGTLINACWKPTRLILQEHTSGTHKLENWSLFTSLFVDSMNMVEHMKRFEIRKKD